MPYVCEIFCCKCKPMTNTYNPAVFHMILLVVVLWWNIYCIYIQSSKIALLPILIFEYFIVHREPNKTNKTYVLDICISFLVHVSVGNICIVKRKELRITLRRGYSSFCRCSSLVQWSNGQHFPILYFFIFLGDILCSISFLISNSGMFAMPLSIY